MTSELLLASRVAPQRRSDIVVHEIDGEALLHDPNSGDTHRLNETALHVWRRCDGRTSANSLAQQLADRYEVSAEQARHHVARILKEFATANLMISTAGIDNNSGTLP